MVWDQNTSWIFLSKPRMLAPVWLFPKLNPNMVKLPLVALLHIFGPCERPGTPSAFRNFKSKLKMHPFASGLLLNLLLFNSSCIFCCFNSKVKHSVLNVLCWRALNLMEDFIVIYRAILAFCPLVICLFFMFDFYSTLDILISLNPLFHISQRPLMPEAFCVAVKLNYEICWLSQYPQ